MTCKNVHVATVAMAVALCGPLSVARAGIKIAVLDVQTTGVDPTLVPVLTEVLMTEVQSFPGVEAISGRDIAQVLGFERQKELVGCTEIACLTELGGALGVERLLVTNIGRIGETFVVNEKLINIRQSQVEDRGYETVTGKIDKVLDILRSMTSRLLEKRALAAQQSQDAKAREAARQAAAREAAARDLAAREAAARDAAARDEEARDAAARDAAAREAVERDVPGRETEPRPLEVEQSGAPARRSRVLPATLTAVGVVGLAAGGWFGFQAKKHADKAGDPSYVGGQLEIERSRSDQKVMAVALAAGGVVTAAGLVWWLWPKTAAPAVAVAPVVGPQGLGLVFATGF